MTYLVMECHPSYAIVPDNEGRMIKAANLGYQEGQVVGEILARQAPKAPHPVPSCSAGRSCLPVPGCIGRRGLWRIRNAVWYSGGENQSRCENVCELYGSRSWSGRCE